MRIKPYRALSGKARRARDRSRVARIQAHALLDDFYRPDDCEVGAERPIPIRGRSEFLPTVVTVAAESGILGEQFDFLPGPIESNTRTVDRSSRLGQVAETRDAASIDASFSGARFLAGCAVGGAAAAALLLVVTIVLG